MRVIIIVVVVVNDDGFILGYRRCHKRYYGRGWRRQRCRRRGRKAPCSRRHQMQLLQQRS